MQAAANLSSDYRETLKKVFLSRREKNPAYSLRSYARDLSVSPSMLSEVLSHKKKLTRKSATKIKDVLRLSKTDAELFLLSVDLEQSSPFQTSETVQTEITQRTSTGRTLNLSDDRFTYISDYRHLVMIALFGVKSFKYNLTWIANSLGVFQFQATKIFKRLQKLGVVQMNAKNEPELKKDFILSPDGIPSEAVRSFHRSTLQQAITAIEGVPFQDRSYYSTFFAIDQNDLPAIQDEVREFHRHLYSKYAQKETADRVYGVQNQLIPYSSRSDQ